MSFQRGGHSTGLSFELTTSASVSIPHGGGPHTIPWDVEEHDPYGFHEANDVCVVLPMAGFLAMEIVIEWQPSALGIREANIRYNGAAFAVPFSDLMYTEREEPASNGPHRMTVGGLSAVRLKAGDKVQPEFFQTSGLALNVVKSGYYSPRFRGTLFPG